MKKELIYYSILTLTIALLLFFETNLFKDNTAYVSKVIDIESFDKLDIDLDCNIYVSLGEEQKVVFEGPAKYLNNVETRLEDGVLKISCKEPGLFSSWINPSDEDTEAVSIYVKLTHADQLIIPKKGNLISNESFQLIKRNTSDIFSLNHDLGNLLRLIGNQFGAIRLR